MVVKKKVVNNNKIYSGLSSSNFDNVTSNTIFSFGNFNITSNFNDSVSLKTGSDLNTYLNPITLETININSAESELLYALSNNAVLNLDFSDINTFVRFGSAYNFLKTNIEKIILTFPASLYINSFGSLITVTNYSYNRITNSSEFTIPINLINNNFELIYASGNSDVSNGELKNLNVSYEKYQMWIPTTGNTINYQVIGFTGSTLTNTNINIKVIGNPLQITPTGDITITGSTSLTFHIKPNESILKKYYKSIDKYQSYILSNKTDSGYTFKIKIPRMLDNGDVIYADNTFNWSTTDKYNIDINSSQYSRFLTAILNVGNLYDQIKTDIIYRLLTTSSLKAYDLTDNKKLSKLIKIYGAEFDKSRQYIDSLVYIDRVTYDKINNVPDQLVSLLASQNGWNYTAIINENNLPNGLFYTDNTLSEELLPHDVDIELWRRLIINTNFYWKSKGTRESIQSILLILGIPIELINIKEFIYNISNPINPNVLDLSIMDFTTGEFPYTSDGYPKTPIDTNNFYFQISGDTDGGQEYLNLFRLAGFDLVKTIDNRKSWVTYTGTTVRSDDSTPNYTINDSNLVLNTKEVDIALDSAQGVEYDVFYSKTGITKTTTGTTSGATSGSTTIITGDTTIITTIIPSGATSGGTITVYETGYVLNEYLKKMLKSEFSNTKFEEFMFMILTECINVRDNKILREYQQLLNIYIKYLQEFESNGYTFNDMYSFLSRYDIYLNTFINTLLPTTAIKKNVGITVKNNNFTRQKFQYKRGILFNDANVVNYEVVYNNTVIDLDDIYSQIDILDNNHLGNDGCLHKRKVYYTGT